MERLRRRNWAPVLAGMLVLLVVLILVLASVAVLQVVLAIMGRFSQAIFLFLLGALVAYLLAPLVDLVQRVVKVRGAAILVVYALAIGVFLALAALLFTPLVSQSEALISNLRNPAHQSLRSINAVQAEAQVLQTKLTDQQATLKAGSSVSGGTIAGTRAAITKLQSDVATLSTTGLVASRGSLPPAGKPSPEAPTAQTQIPPSYVAPIANQVSRLQEDYKRATATAGVVSTTYLDRAVSDAKQASGLARSTGQKVASIPLIVLRLQFWLDQHSINVNLASSFGRAVQQISSSSATIVNSALDIVLSAGTLLVNAFLIIIISVYFLSDGKRLIRRAVGLCPESAQDQARFFLTSLDRVMGGYIRGQLILAALAGFLGGVGAQAIGVPYAVLIGLVTFVLSLIPVIGAVIIPIPPVVIAALTVPPYKVAILGVYFLAFMQIVTNVIGPKVVGKSVGIHPLEAMAAALIGYPLAGFLGSFLAVPTVGFLHIVGREVYRHFILGEAIPGVEDTEPVAAAPVPPPDKPAPAGRTV